MTYALRTRAAGLAAVAALSLTATAVGVAPTTAAPSPTASTAAASSTLPTGPLDILLTNDDGWNAPGIQAVREALVAEGHHVTLVAPATNQSGVSARVDFSGTITAIEQEEDVWSVTTSPVGAVLFALDAVLDDEPDLIISGTNVGSNTGFDTNFSGTIGAATLGSGMFGIPSIAVSTDTGYGAGATGAYEQTAELVVDLIDRGLPRLPRGQFLNINYPKLNAERPEPVGVAYVANAQASAAAFSYVQQEDPTQYRIVGALGTERPAPGTDTDMLAKGYVTVGVLDADRSVAREAVPAIADLVTRLNGFVPEAPVARIAKLPKRVAAKSKVWLPTTNIADGDTVQATWVKDTKKKQRTVSTAKVKSGLVKLSTPKKAGRYTVTIATGGRHLGSAKVTVR